MTTTFFRPLTISLCAALAQLCFEWKELLLQGGNRKGSIGERTESGNQVFSKDCIRLGILPYGGDPNQIAQNALL